MKPPPDVTEVKKMLRETMNLGREASVLELAERALDCIVQMEGVLESKFAGMVTLPTSGHGEITWAKEETMEQAVLEMINPINPPPCRTYVGDAGLDVKSPHDVLLEPGRVTRIGLGFKLQLPPGHCALVVERSGHAFKQGITSVGPLIDPNYRGEVHAQLHNGTDKLVHFNTGDRICQLLIFKFHDQDPVLGKVDQTQRGERGMGSSGT